MSGRLNAFVSHYLTVSVYLLFIALGIALDILAHRPKSRIPTIGRVFSRIMHTRSGRIAVVAWWALIGFHLFSK